MSPTYTLRNVKREICTLILPSTHSRRLKVVALRTGVPRNAIAALAVDEYLERHYPERRVEEGVRDGRGE